MAIVTVKVPDGLECRDKGYWGDCKFIKTKPSKASNGTCMLYEQEIEYLGSCNTSVGRLFHKCEACLSHTIKED